MSYIALSNIIHNGVKYSAGDEIADMSADQANVLIRDGIVKNSDPSVIPVAPATGADASNEPADKPETEAAKTGLMDRILGRKPADAPSEPEAPAADPSAGL